MDSLNLKKEKRYMFLKTLYEAVNGVSGSSSEDMWDIGESLGMDRQETSNITNYLVNEGLIKHFSLGGGIVITHQGVREVEEAIQNPDRETKYFPAVNLIYVGGNMINSNTQQASNHSTQTVTYGSSETKSIEDFLSELKAKMPQLELKQIDKETVESDIATIEAQLVSPRPKHAFVAECLKSIKATLECAAGGVIAGGLLAMFPHLPN